jgi:hypothetical protein
MRLVSIAAQVLSMLGVRIQYLEDLAYDYLMAVLWQITATRAADTIRLPSLFLIK